MHKIILLAFLLVVGSSCNHPRNKDSDQQTWLTVFHAGSLAVPFKVLADSFTKHNPEVRFRMEAAGSLETVRKITELSKQADIVALSDNGLIEKMLVPLHAQGSLPFAGNEMVIAYSGHSRKREYITAGNWPEVLTKHGIAVGRSNPDLDPCGYRTVLLLQLAETYYHRPGLAENLLRHSQANLRPKESDLIALLQTGHLDYIFIYSSMAVQHNLDFIRLPDEINLSKQSFDHLYSKASTKVMGQKKGEWINITGEAITYGLTIPYKAPNAKQAERFVTFITSQEGKKILMDLGHTVPVWDDSPKESGITDML